jgi:Flp pilus assembly protein TadG
MGRKAAGRAVARCRGERGAAMVEFALILPLVVLLTFGIIEFAIAYNTNSNINQAGRAGGRTAAILSTDPQMAYKAGAAAATSLDISVNSVSGTPRVCVAKFNPANPTDCLNQATATVMPLTHPGTPNSPVWQITAQNPDGTFPPSDNWPVSSRNFGCPVGGSPGTYDKVIVYVEANHKLLVPGIFGVFFSNNSSPKMTATAVFQLEPVTTNTCG